MECQSTMHYSGLAWAINGSHPTAPAPPAASGQSIEPPGERASLTLSHPVIPVKESEVSQPGNSAGKRGNEPFKAVFPERRRARREERAPHEGGRGPARLLSETSMKVMRCVGGGPEAGRGGRGPERALLRRERAARDGRARTEARNVPVRALSERSM